MAWLRVALTVAGAALPLALVVWLWRREVVRALVAGRRLLWVTAAGIATALAVLPVERWLLAWMGLSLSAAPGRALSAALAMLLVVAPLEEGAKWAVVQLLNRRHPVTTRRAGVLYAASAGAGFAAVELLLTLWWDTPGWLPLLRAGIALPAQIFFAGVWGNSLSTARRRGRWELPLAWCGATLGHGLYDHVVFGRGPALLIVVVPLLLMMALGVWSVVREVAPAETAGRLAFLEPPSVRTVRRAMAPRGRPLALHWIALGALVTLGVTLSCVALAVYLGHRWGVDFAGLDEGDIVATVPLALLGGALLAAFPVSGFLIARASGATSVLEPAWATGAAIVLTLMLFSVTEPLALIVTASVAPVGFALACVGAWLGLDRSS